VRGGRIRNPKNENRRKTEIRRPKGGEENGNRSSEGTSDWKVALTGRLENLPYNPAYVDVAAEKITGGR
jgi:hypothetical protein